MSFGASLLPRKMKQVEITVLARDIDPVIEFLGRGAVMHFPKPESAKPDDDGGQNHAGPGRAEGALKQIRENLGKLANAAAWLALPLPAAPSESTYFPGEAEEALTGTITQAVSALSGREKELGDEKRKVEDTLNEARAFTNLNAPFSDLDQLSYLTLRIGRMDPRRQDELRQNLADRAVIIPLGPGDGKGSSGRFLAAASRKGRFALDSELKNADFVPIEIPEGYKGVPSELLSGLEGRLAGVLGELKEIDNRKGALRDEYGPSLRSLTASFLMAAIAEELKARLVATANVYLLSGWVPADRLKTLVDDLEKLTGNRIAVRACDPEELSEVAEGREKVPVSLHHGAFVKGFEGVVFSYGAPLYGTIDPTPLVAFFFTVLFGIMFGDLGHGFVLFLLGFLTGKRGIKILSGFRKFSVPLLAVGVSSMIMGVLNGSVFTNEYLLVGITRAVTGLITGRPIDRILVIMPLTEKGGSVVKLFYFFGFTIGVGVLLNSAGLVVNTVNQFFRGNYEKAFFSRTGAAGILLFWYAMFIAIRFANAALNPGTAGFGLHWFDYAALLACLAGITFGPALWRLISGVRPVFAEGVTVFFMEGLVEVLETISTYVSNTVSFLRVGAFALSHAVLSYIVFRFAEQVSTSGFAFGAAFGAAVGALILIFGNAVIIILEGMIVAIQVMRLQYYEFFSKFFTDTGVEFSPFTFR